MDFCLGALSLIKKDKWLRNKGLYYAYVIPSHSKILISVTISQANMVYQIRLEPG